MTSGGRALDVDPVPFGHTMPLELGPQVFDHGGVGQSAGVGRFVAPVPHALLDHVDGGAQHGVVERNALRRAGLCEEVDHEGVEDALGHRRVAAVGEGGNRPAAAVSTILF